MVFFQSLRRGALFGLAAFAACFGAVATVRAATAANANIPALIRQLDSDAFAARDYSAQKLFELGSPAIAPLTQAAQGQSLEQTTAAVRILRKFLDSNDAGTKQSARAALEQIVKGDCDSAANLAADALRPSAVAQNSINAPTGQIFLGNGNVRMIRRVVIAGRPVQIIQRGAPMIPVNPIVKPAPVAPPTKPAPPKPPDATK